MLLATCSRLGRAPRPPLPTVPPGSGTGGAIAGGKAPRARRASRRPRRAPPRAIQRRRAVRVRDAACWLLGRRALQLTPPWASDGTKLPRLVRQETPGGLADAPCSWGGVRKNTSKQVCSTCGRSSPVATAFVQCKADGTVPPGALSAKIQQAKDAIECAPSLPVPAIAGHTCRSRFGVQALACLGIQALSLTVSCGASMPRHTRIIRVDEMTPFLVTDLEILGAYQMESRPGLYFQGSPGRRPVSPFMPRDWWWVPALTQGTYVLAQLPSPTQRAVQWTWGVAEIAAGGASLMQDEVQHSAPGAGGLVPLARCRVRGGLSWVAATYACRGVAIRQSTRGRAVSVRSALPTNLACVHK